MRRLRIFFFVLMMMLYLSAGLSHWWNHMVPALTRDGFPQCARLGLWTSFGDVDGYMLTYITCSHTSYTHTRAHDTHTHIHTCPHGMHSGMVVRAVETDARVIGS